MQQIRQLLRECDGGQQAYKSGLVGYCWSRGLRSAQTAIVPADRRLLDLLFYRQPFVFRQC